MFIRMKYAKEDAVIVPLDRVVFYVSIVRSHSHVASTIRFGC